MNCAAGEVDPVSWDRDEIVKAGIAGYSIPCSTKHYAWDIQNIDYYTPRGDYSSDVVARAQYFRENGYK